MSKRHFLEFEQPIAELETKIDELRYVQTESAVDISEEIDRLGKKSQQLTKDIYSSLTPWQVLTHLRAIVMVDVEFDTRDGRRLLLQRITIPEKEQAALLLQLRWTLPEQPPPRIRANPSTDH